MPSFISPEYSFYFGDKKCPQQHSHASSLQQQSPQHSPFIFAFRSVSHSMTQRKRVKTDRYRQRMQREANKQKSLRAGRDVVAPKMKASTFVNDVIVIDGPE